MRSAGMKERFATLATEGAYIKSEIAKWSDAIRKAGLKAE